MILFDCTAKICNVQGAMAYHSRNIESVFVGCWTLHMGTCPYWNSIYDRQSSHRNLGTVKIAKMCLHKYYYYISVQILKHRLKYTQKSETKVNSTYTALRYHSIVYKRYYTLNVAISIPNTDRRSQKLLPFQSSSAMSTYHL